MRHSATQSLLERNVVIVASVSCIYGIGSVELYSNMVVKLQRGGSIGSATPDQGAGGAAVPPQRRRLPARHLPRARRERGYLALPSGRPRLAHQLFGDEMDGLREFDPLTGEIAGEMESVAIYANSHYVTPRPTMIQAIRDIRIELKETAGAAEAEGKLLEAQRLEQRTTFDLEMMETTGSCKGIENYSRYLSGRGPGNPPPTLFEYLPENALLIVDESHVTVPQIGGMYRGDFARKTILSEFGFRLPSCMDNRPLKFEEWESFRPDTVFVSATPGPWEMERTGGTFAEQVIRPTGLIDPPVEIRPVEGQVDDLMAECRTVIGQGGRILVTVLTKRMAET
jgi:excinuclease ABC subunit B